MKEHQDKAEALFNYLKMAHDKDTLECLVALMLREGYGVSEESVSQALWARQVDSRLTTLGAKVDVLLSRVGTGVTTGPGRVKTGVPEPVVFVNPRPDTPIRRTRPRLDEIPPWDGVAVALYGVAPMTTPPQVPNQGSATVGTVRSPTSFEFEEGESAEIPQPGSTEDE